MFAQQFQIPFTIGGITCKVHVAFYPQINFIQWHLVDSNNKEGYQVNRHLTEEIANHITNHILTSLGQPQ